VELGIDLGTANTVISDLRKGIVVDEPSVVLLRRGGPRRGRLVAVGNAAAELLGRAPSEFVAVRPLHDGVITDLETARLYLRAIAEKAGRRWWTGPTRAVIGVPVGATALERRALLEAAEEAGIRPVTALDESIAGAVGCGIDPLERRVSTVAHAVTHYWLDHDRCPTKASDLIANGYVDARSLEDPWGGRIEFFCSDETASARSDGPDRAFGTSDDIMSES